MGPEIRVPTSSTFSLHDSENQTHDMPPKSSITRLTGRAYGSSTAQPQVQAQEELPPPPDINGENETEISFEDEVPGQATNGSDRPNLEDGQTMHSASRASTREAIHTEEGRGPIEDDDASSSDDEEKISSGILYAV